MGKKTKVAISEELSNYIEGLQYELNARKTLCEFLMSKGLTQTDDFKYYHDQYVECYAAYELAKNELEHIYIIPNIEGSFSGWTLDFYTHEVTVNEK